MAATNEIRYRTDPTTLSMRCGARTEVEAPMMEETEDAKARRLLRTGERDSLLHRVEYCRSEKALAGREFLDTLLATEYGLSSGVSLRQMQTMRGVPKDSWACLAQDYRLFLVQSGVARACYNPTGSAGDL